MNALSLYPTGSLIANRYEVVQGPAEKRSLRGGMGLVYLCLDRQEVRPVALKTFQPQFLPDRATRDRFLREGTTWVDLGRHPHIVRCYEVERVGDGREVYLALELVAQEPGRPDASLRAWLTPGQPLPVAQALLFALQIVRGMEHACETLPGFVHRDLKPENVLVGADRLASLGTNRLRVTDFGLANILSGARVSSQASGEPDDPDTLSRTQLTHGIVGTPQYMAPEQWTGRQVGLYTDVYALGCILFEMLTGQRAVMGRTLKALEQAHCAGQIQALPPALPAAVRSLVAGCLTVTPEARYTTWHALEATLTVIWQQVTGQALPPTVAPLALAREERLAVGWSYNNIGHSYLDLGKADVARDYFVRAQTVGQAEGEPALDGAALGNLGTAYKNLGDARQALRFHEQHLAIARALGDRRGEGQALGNLGMAYTALGDAQQALGFYEQALELYRALGDRGGEGAALGNLGIAYKNLGDARRAIEYHVQALEIARASGYRQGEGATLGNLGLAYQNLGDARQALGFYEQALVASREIGDRRGEGAALGNLGMAYAALGDARRAIGFYEQRLEIAREIGDRRGEGQTLGNLGSAYDALDDARRAIGFYEQCLELHREIGARHGEGAALGNLGTAYKNLGDARRAIEFYEQALTIQREIGDVSMVASVSFNMALLYAQQGEAARARPLAQEAAHIWSQIGSPYAQRAQQLLAQLQSGGTPVQTNSIQAAFEAFQRAGSAQEIQAAVAQSPFMTQAGFIQAIEEVIKQQVPPEHQPAFQQRLAWLKQIAPT